MGDITEFLTARYDEREADLLRLLDDPYSGDGVAFAVRGGTVEWSARDELADIAAKRAIVALHQPLTIKWDGKLCRECVERVGPDEDLRPCETVRLLAQPYAEHPDFDPAWRV